MTSERSQWRRSGVFIVNFEHNFTLFPSVFFLNFEHVITGWASSVASLKQNLGNINIGTPIWLTHNYQINSPLNLLSKSYH